MSEGAQSTSPLALVLSPRATVVAFTLAGVVAAVLGVLPSDSAAAWLLRVFGAGVLVTVVPGALTVLAWRPRDTFSLLELIGISLGVSFALVQLVTIAAVLYAWPVDASIAVLAGWTIAHAVVAARRRGTGVGVSASYGEAALAMVLVLLGIALYAAGSPFDTSEPRIHVAIVRRLVHLASPTLYTMYFAPDIVYTYPFPGTHYMLALMARLEGIDPLFLYIKTRAVWGVAAPILLYGCAQAIFGSTRIALATTFVAVGLVANGAFGGVPGFSWAQLAPYTHASDIAMGVLLPALLLMAFQVLHASQRRERLFFLAVTLALALMLIMVHPREIVQFLVYFTVFVALMRAGRDSRQLAVRAAVLVVATLAVLITYRIWHQSAVPAIDTMVERERSGLTELFREASWGELLRPPLPLLRNYVVAFEPTFHGWNPVVLLASPFALFLLRRRALTLLVAASIVCYLLIIRFPLLGIPYIYLTYFEILYTPVRNVIFFVHLLAGVCLYLLAARLARYNYVVVISMALAFAVLGTLAVRWMGPYLTEQPRSADLLFAPVLMAYAALGWWAWSRRDRPPDDGWVDAPRPRWILAMAALSVPMLVATELPESSLRHVAWAASPGTPDALLSSLPCVEDRRFCPPPKALIRLAQSELPVDSVFAVDIEDLYQPSLFMPQQMVAWPGHAEGLIPRALFVRYYERYDRANAAYGEQPLFNDRETRTERLSFIRDLGVTHVLVNPRFHDLMSVVLARDPDVFTARYNDGRWALYEVAPGYRAVRL